MRTSMAVPLGDLGITDNSFGLNACRERRAADEPELSCWAPTGGQFGRPSTFGGASFGQAWIESVHSEPAILGTNPVEVWLRNEEAAARKLLVTLATAAGEVLARKNVRAAPDETTGVRLRWQLTRPDAPDVVVRVRDAGAPGLVLAERPISPEVRPPLTLRLHPQKFIVRDALLTVEVNLGPDLREQSRLVVELESLDDPGTRKSQKIPAIEAGRLECALAVEWLPPGRYELAVRLLAGDGKTLSVATEQIRVIEPAVN